MRDIFNKQNINSTTLTTFLLVTSLLVFSSFVQAADIRGPNIVTAVVNAPVSANGTIAGNPSEFQIWLNSPKSPAPQYDFDPQYFGHQIPAGGKMIVTLGGTFQTNPNFTGGLNPLFHAAILNGHQHNPIVPGQSSVESHHGNWTIQDFDHANMTFAVVPLGGEGKNGFEGNRAKKIGLKHLHLRPDPRLALTDPNKTPFYNGPAGTIGTVSVTVVDSMGTVLEEGHGSVMFRATLGRVSGLNNQGIVREPILLPGTGNDLIESMNWQHVPPNAQLTLTTLQPADIGFFDNGFYALRFLMLEKQELQSGQFLPFDLIPDISYSVDPNEPWSATLTENGNVIGSVVMDGPTADSRGTLLAPVGDTTSAKTSRLLVPCKVGSQRGVYTVTVSFLDGNSTTASILVE